MRFREARAFSRACAGRFAAKRPVLTAIALRPAVVWLGLFTLALVLVAGGCATREAVSGGGTRHAFVQAQMGLEFRITLYASDAQSARSAAESAFARIAALNAVFSDYDADSELSQLSRTSGTDQWVRVSEDLWRVLIAAQRLAENYPAPST